MEDTMTVKMVRLEPKTGGGKPEIQITALGDELEARGMPMIARNHFLNNLRKGKTIDGETVFAELASIIFVPFTITDEQAKLRHMIIRQ